MNATGNRMPRLTTTDESTRRRQSLAGIGDGPRRGTRNRVPFIRVTCKRAAFTLLELMLVLTIVVMIGALVTPRLGEVFERQQVSGAANTLRMAWDRARLDAMRTGQAQVFTCQLGTGTYTVKPLMLQADAATAAAGAEVMVAGGVVEMQESGIATAADMSDDSEQLENDVTFLSCLVAGDMRAYEVAQESQMTGTGDLTTQTLASNVVFYPDGSTSNAEVQVQNKRGDVRGVRMRGLTGHAKVVTITNVASESDK